MSIILKNNLGFSQTKYKTIIMSVNTKMSMAILLCCSALVSLLLILSVEAASYGTNGCQEIDDLLSDVWRVGDSNRLWPEHDSSFQQYCLNSIENNDKILSFFDKVFPDNLHIQVLARLTSVERTRVLMKFCRNREMRAKALGIFKAMNKGVTKMEKCRHTAVNKLIAAAEPGSNMTFKDMLEILKTYEEGSIKSIDKDWQPVLKDVMDTNRRLVYFYLSNVKLLKLKRVNANPCPKEWRPYSLLYAEAIAFNRIFSDIQ